MIKFHSIQRKVEKSDPSTQVILHMYYEDVSDLCHLLWECRKKGMLQTENEKLLQLEFQNLRHLMIDGQTCDPFEICSIHERLEEMGCGDEKQGFDRWHDIVSYPDDLPIGGDWVVVVLQNEEGQTFDKPHIAKYCRPEWYLVDNTKIGIDRFKYKVIKWKSL